MRHLEEKLGVAGIRRLKAEVESLRGELPRKADEICRRLAGIGLDVAVSMVPVDTGELLGSMALVREGASHYLVIAGSSHAAFVEFGTGVVGKGSYPATLPAGWQYEAMWSPWAHDADDPSAWYYFDRDGKRHKTRGQRGSAYMASAAEAMRQDALKVAKEVLVTWA